MLGLPRYQNQIYTHTHNHLMALFPGLPGWDSVRRKLLLDFMCNRRYL